MLTQSGEVLEYYQSLKLIRAKKSGQNLVTESCEPTREFDINERIASFPTIYDTLYGDTYRIARYRLILKFNIFRTKKDIYKL